MLVTTLLHYNIQLALLHRSPGVPMQSLINVFMYMLNHIDISLPTIIMGDFNEDICDTSLLVTCMSKDNNHQIVMTLLQIEEL